MLLSLATVGSAWCSYQASAWATRSTKLSIQSSSRGRQAEATRLKANQMFILDVNLIGNYVEAHYASNEPLARFYAGKFRRELKEAFDGWMREQPFENPDAPPHPFVHGLYEPRMLAEADIIETESERLWGESSEAARMGHAYIPVSVLLATALFFAGTAPQFETYKSRRIVLTLGLLALLTALTMFLRLPLTTSADVSRAQIPENLRR